MTATATLTAKCQVTIPAAVRDALGLAPGDRLRFARNAAGEMVVEKAPSGFAELRGIVKLDRPVTGEEIDAWAREARDGGWSRDRE